MDEPTWILDDYSLRPLSPPAHRVVETEDEEHYDYSLVITGEVFRWMLNNAPLETLQRVRSTVTSNIAMLIQHR